MEPNMETRTHTTTVRKLTESALLVALATALGLFAVFKLPYGGSVTIGSMIPIMLVSLKYPMNWAIPVAFVYSLIQMLTGFYAPPVETLGFYVLMVLLDYVVAFGVLSLAGPVFRALRQDLPARFRLVAAAICCFALRFLCHFLSGIIIWGVYAPPEQPAWLYSLLYNGTYMLGECVVTGLILFTAGQKLMQHFLNETR